ncbi:polyamine transporter 4 [Rhypophila sp. PSN 637]
MKNDESSTTDLESQMVQPSTPKPPLTDKSNPTTTALDDDDANNELELDWSSPEDPLNPMNWPTPKKLLHSAIPAVYSFGLTTGISTVVASVPTLMSHFSVSRNVALLPIVLYTFGFVIGPSIASPLSEIYGRRIIYWTNFPILVVFNAVAAASDNFAALVICRFIAGVGGSGVLAVGGGSLSELWEPKDAGRVTVSYIIAPFLGPTLGPLIGAYTVNQYGGDWKWSIWVVLCILAPVGVALIFMKETSKRQILEARAKREGMMEKRRKRPVASWGEIGKAMLRPLHMTVVEPLSLALGLYTGFSFSMVFSFFGSYAYVYSTVYHFNSRQIGLCYIAVIVGFLFAIATFGYFDAKKYRPAAERTGGKVPPETRLYSALVGCWLVPIGLFWYAWTPRESIHWIVSVLAGFPFGWGTLASFLSCMAYIADTYMVANTASAIAANGMIRFTLSAVFPLFIIQVYEGLGIHWAGSLFAFISVAFIPVPWYLFYRGRALRAKSHYPTCPY